MPRLTSLLSEEWRIRLESKASPPIKSLEQLLLSDSLTLALQLGCTADCIEQIKGEANTKWINSLQFSPPIDDLQKKKTKINTWKDLSSPFPLDSTIDPLLDFSISTGNLSMNQMTGSNGLMRSQIHLFLSESGHGKTQTCLTIACNAVYEGYRVLIIDTNNSWTFKRINSYFNYHLISIAFANKSESQTEMNLLDNEERNNKLLEMLSRLSIVKCFDLFRGMQLIQELSQRSSEQVNEINKDQEKLPYDLIILDSLFHWISPYLNTNREDVSALKTMTLKRKSSELHQETQLENMSGLTNTIASPVTNSLQTISFTSNVHPYLSHLNILLRNLTTSTHCATIITNSLYIDSRFKINLNSYFSSLNNPSTSFLNVNEIKSFYSSNLPAQFSNNKKDLMSLRNNLISGLGSVTHESLSHYDTVWLLNSPSFNFINNFNEDILKFKIQYHKNKNVSTTSSPANIANKYSNYIDKIVIHLYIIHRPPYLNTKPEFGEIILPNIS